MNKKSISYADYLRIFLDWHYGAKMSKTPAFRKMVMDFKKFYKSQYIGRNLNERKS